MPIYQKQSKRVLHAHIPKTGGSSILQMAKANGWTVTHTGSEQHATSRQYRRWKYNACFTVVREPVDRMKSFLAMRRIPQGNAADMVGAWLRNHWRDTFHDKSNWKEVMVLPQTWFVSDDCEWAKYGEENSLLEKHLGTSERERVRVAPEPKYDLDTATVGLIHEFYAGDYERFGFTRASNGVSS